MNLKYAQRYADIITHSYHPVKQITTGEGGALFTNDKKLYLTSFSVIPMIDNVVDLFAGENANISLYNTNPIISKINFMYFFGF